MPDSKKHLIYRFGIIILLVGAVYGTTLTHGFVWDDTYIIANNPLLEKLENIPRFFLSEDTIEESTGYYRPVTYVSFALERALWGIDPAGFHVTNLVLHILVVLLFYAVIAALFRKERLAFVAALIFALHPLAGETVNFLAGGRNTLLSACFALLSLLFYIRDKRILAAASFTVAIFSKEFALLMPVVFLVCDYRLLQKKVRFRGYVPYLAPVAFYLVLRSFAVQKANFLSAINLHDMMMAPYLVVRYALNMILPFQLKVLYDVKLNLAIGILCLVVVVAMTGAIFILRKYDELLFSICWFFLFLLPVINIIPLHATSVMADRYAYFSLMGFALCLATVVCKGSARAVTTVVVVLCVLYSLIDFSRNGIWQNEIVFFTRMTHDAPEKFAGYQNLGRCYYKKGDVAHAVHYLAISSSKPDIFVKYLLGNAYIFWKENVPDKAEKTLNRVLELEPANPDPYLLLILMHEREGNTALAQSYREKAHKFYPKIEELIPNRIVELCQVGEQFMAKQQYTEAEVYLWQALKINPEYVPALIDMGSLSAEQGKYADAIQYLNKVLAIDPLNASAHFNLAMVYKMQGRVADAQQEMIKFKEAEAAAKQKRGSASGS